MTPPLSVIFCGTSDFAVPSLRALAVDPAFTIELVITQPDRPYGRNQQLRPTPVKRAAQELGLPLVQPENINTLLNTHDGQPHTLKHPDFLVVVSYGQLFGEALLQFPKIAPVNVHASLLPRWRGASPIQHAILSGDTETGVTVQKMVKALDAGPILSQETMTMPPRVVAPILHDALAALGSTLLVRTLKAPLEPREQDASHMTLCKKLHREDGKVSIDDMTAEEIDRKVRALNPWPGVSIEGKNGEVLKILETSLEPTSGAISVECKSGSQLYIAKVLVPGGKPISGVEWERAQTQRK